MNKLELNLKKNKNTNSLVELNNKLGKLLFLKEKITHIQNYFFKINLYLFSAMVLFVVLISYLLFFNVISVYFSTSLLCLILTIFFYFVFKNNSTDSQAFNNLSLSNDDLLNINSELKNHNLTVLNFETPKSFLDWLIYLKQIYFIIPKNKQVIT